MGKSGEHDIGLQVGEDLVAHPEAPSLFAEAAHRHALAEESAFEVRRTHAVMQAARLRYEELRHRMDPRGSRAVHFGVTCGVLGAMSGVWTVLGAAELAGVMARWTAWMVAA